MIVSEPAEYSRGCEGMASSVGQGVRPGAAVEGCRSSDVQSLDLERVISAEQLSREFRIELDLIPGPLTHVEDIDIIATSQRGISADDN